MNRPNRPERREHELRATVASLFLALIDEEDRETAFTADNPAWVGSQDFNVGRARQKAIQQSIDFYAAELERVRAVLDRGSSGANVWWGPTEPATPALVKDDGTPFVLPTDHLEEPPSIGDAVAAEMAANAPEPVAIAVAADAEPAFGTYGNLIYS